MTVTDFDNLDARSQSGVLSCLVSKLIDARCGSLRELSVRVHLTPSAVWRNICVESGVESCSIPSHIAGKAH